MWDKWFSLDGKKSVVVGASRGLGREIALALAQAGADVACVDKNARQLEEVVGEISARGRRSAALSADITKEEEVVKMSQEVQRIFGGVDILFYSAGILEFKMALDCSLEDWHRTCDVNLTGAFLTVREIGKIMKEGGGGKIILIASTFGDRILPYVLPYVVSKGGILQMVRNLSYEWAKFGICVNGIAPGYFATDMTSQVLNDPKTKDQILKRIPLRRVGEPAEIGPLAVYLASRASDYMTGETIRIDGGQANNIS